VWVQLQSEIQMDSSVILLCLIPDVYPIDPTKQLLVSKSMALLSPCGNSPSWMCEHSECKRKYYPLTSLIPEWTPDNLGRKTPHVEGMHGSTHL
jgi:hypothetical protein